MLDFCIRNLEQLRGLLKKLDPSVYNYPSKHLTGSSVGAHARHVIECYHCMLDGLSAGVVNYDNRERDPEMEQNPDVALEAIERLINRLKHLSVSGQILLKSNLSGQDGSGINIESSAKRELLHNIDHSIHHQALIKVALIEQGHDNFIPADFGVAPATIRSKTG